MILAEKHSIKNNRKNRELFERIDKYCYLSKNLYNAANYLVTQCTRISYNLKQGEILESWEKKFIYDINCAIRNYNADRPNKMPIKYIDGSNGFIADANFLNWYLKILYRR